MRDFDEFNIVTRFSSASTPIQSAVRSLGAPAAQTEVDSGQPTPPQMQI